MAQITDISDQDKMPDERNHFKMTRVATSGDSGGAVFDLCGEFVGMMIECESAHSLHMIPIPEITRLWLG